MPAVVEKAWIQWKLMRDCQTPLRNVAADQDGGQEDKASCPLAEWDKLQVAHHPPSFSVGEIDTDLAGGTDPADNEAVAVDNS